MKDKVNYRIENKDKTFLNAGTGLDSFFTIEKARELVNYDAQQRIVLLMGFNEIKNSHVYLETF